MSITYIQRIVMIFTHTSLWMLNYVYIKTLHCWLRELTAEQFALVGNKSICFILYVTYYDSSMIFKTNKALSIIGFGNFITVVNIMTLKEYFCVWKEELKIKYIQKVQSIKSTQ